MTEPSEVPYFVRENVALASIGPQDDYLHPERNRLIVDATLTETQYFGFSVPEARIQGLGYLWHHPNLKTVSGGLLVWRGVKLHMQQAELCDYRGFMSDAALKNDLNAYRLDNGYGVAVLEPLKRHRMTYVEAGGRSSVDIEFEAVAPAVMYADGNHFEQAMRARGELILRGERHSVDCLTIRDRSWGKPRPENNYPIPPISWMNAVFPSGTAFNCNMFDDARENPELRGTPFEMPADKVVNGGWLYRDGKVGRIAKGSKRIERDPRTSIPLSIEIEALDELGRTLNARATMTAALPYQMWFNSLFVSAQLRWECDGEVTCGDSQEALWSDYLNRFRVCD
ncbi:MAG: hypothetical protein ABW110_23540 [Steroidobacteraceae bacterium]